MSKNDPQAVDKYIASFPEDVEQILTKIRQILKETLPGATEGISYGMPAYYVKDSGYALVYFSAWKKHIGLYPAYAPENGQSDPFEKYRAAKNSLNIPFSEPFPYDVIKQFAEYKLKEQKDEDRDKD